MADCRARGIEFVWGVSPGLDIRHARVVTLGDNVVDTFYLTERDGGLLDDSRRRDELTRSLLAVLT